MTVFPKLLVTALAAATSASGQLIAHPTTTSLAVLARRFPATIDLPAFPGTSTYGFTSPDRLHDLIESDGKLYILVSAASKNGHAALLALGDRAFTVVSVPGGPFVSLAVTERGQNFALLRGVTAGKRPQVRHLRLLHGSVTTTTEVGDGSRPVPASGVACLDARATSAYNGPALVIIDAVSGESRPSISKETLSAATDDASSDRSIAVHCHAFGPDIVVWLASGGAGRSVAPSGVTLLFSDRLRPLVDVAPIAISDHYVLFARGDALDDTTPVTYTLLHTP